MSTPCRGMKPLLVQFGAGNIGRSLMGDVFSQAGYRICFVDVDEQLIADLNKRRSYELTYRDGACDDRTRLIEDVRAINFRDRQAVDEAVLEADLLGVSVGKAALKILAAALASALQSRLKARDGGIDLIIAENLRDPAQHLRGLLAPHFDHGFPDDAIGLVATCIGRMVPVQNPAADRRGDVVAESARDFFGDLNGFRQVPPQTTGLRLVEEIDAYVDRKLFLHNMTHSALAYLAARDAVRCQTIADAVNAGWVRRQARAAAADVIAGLVRAYPQVFSSTDLSAYVDGLFRRYDNAALGDTCARVGRDLPRKLGRSERIVGACCLLAQQHQPFDSLASIFRAAAYFDDPVLGGRPFDLGVNLASLCGLQVDQPAELRVFDALNSRRAATLAG